MPNIHFPAFDKLPRVPGAPQGCLWGFYDGNGKDEIGGDLKKLAAPTDNH